MMVSSSNESPSYPHIPQYRPHQQPLDLATPRARILLERAVRFLDGDLAPGHG